MLHLHSILSPLNQCSILFTPIQVTGSLHLTDSCRLHELSRTNAKSTWLWTLPARLFLCVGNPLPLCWQKKMNGSQKDTRLIGWQALSRSYLIQQVGRLLQIMVLSMGHEKLPGLVCLHRSAHWNLSLSPPYYIFLPLSPVPHLSVIFAATALHILFQHSERKAHAHIIVLMDASPGVRRTHPFHMGSEKNL